MNIYNRYSEKLGYTIPRGVCRIKPRGQKILIEWCWERERADSELTKTIARHIVLMREIPELASLPFLVAKRFLEPHGINFQVDYVRNYLPELYKNLEDIYPTITALAGINTEIIKQDLYEKLGLEYPSPLVEIMLREYERDYGRGFSRLSHPHKVDTPEEATYIAIGFEDEQTVEELDGAIIFSPHPPKFTINNLREFKAQGKKLIFGSEEQRKGALKLGDSFAPTDNFPYQNYKKAENEIEKYLVVGLGLFPALYYANRYLLKGFDTGSEVLNYIIRSDIKRHHYHRRLSPEQKEYFYQEVMKNDPEIIQAYSEFAVRLLEAVSK